MKHDSMADRVLVTLSALTDQAARLTVIVYEDGTAEFFALRDTSEADLAFIMRYNADQLHPPSCLHVEARETNAPICTVCGTVMPKGGWR